MRRTIGIDPGLSGAVAGICDRQLIDAFDMPVVEVAWDKKKRSDVSPALLHDALLDLQERMGGNIELAVIERVTASPQMGVVSAFRFGQAYATAVAVVACMGISIAHVPPSNWKRQMGLSKDKGLSRAKAIGLWPDRSELFAKVKHDGRAEAALLAEYGRINYT